MSDKLRVYIVAGEPSGDLLASRLMKALTKKTNGNVEFFGVGGETMQELGFKSLFDSSELAVMGLMEVIPSIPKILGRIRQTVNDIVEKKADVLITVDSWSFSARINKGLKFLNKSIPQIHYVAPQVWAWKKRRAKTCGKYIDMLMTLLPFEEKYFTPHGLKTEFVGHPVVESGAKNGNRLNFRKEFNLSENDKVLCVLPGSRKSEIKFLLPVFKKTVDILAKKYPDMKVFVPSVVTVEKVVKEHVKSWALPTTVVIGQDNRYDVFAGADVALAASGTVALELAMAKIPYTIAYQLNSLSAFIAKLIIKGKYANLVNILANREIVKEYLLDKCNPDLLSKEIIELLENKEYATKEVEDAIKSLECLGLNQEELPSDKAADVVLSFIKRK